MILFVDVGVLEEIHDVSWIRLSENDPIAQQFDAIVADLRADIPDHCERFIADRALEGTLVMHVKQMQESLTGRVAIETCRRTRSVRSSPASYKRR